MDKSAPLPAFFGIVEIYEAPELEKAPAKGLVNTMHIQAESALRERADAANTGVAIGVARDAAIA